MPPSYPPTSLEHVRELRPLTGHDGLSGAELYRGVLIDGTPVIAKRSVADGDVFRRLLGHRTSLELALWREGVLDRLPDGVSSPTIGGWTELDASWIVMRDLGDTIIGSDHPFDDVEVDRLLDRLDRLHFSGLRPAAMTSLAAAIAMFSPPRVAEFGTVDLTTAVEGGWAAFRDLAPAGVADSVVALACDPAPLVAALEARPIGFCHGDIAGVNLAWQGDNLTLLDWGQAVLAPPAFDIARFLPSGLRSSILTNDDLLNRYRAVTGTRFDEIALELSLLAAFVWYGWRKALDIVEARDAVRRTVEAEALAWWVDRLPRAVSLLT